MLYIIYNHNISRKQSFSECNFCYDKTLLYFVYTIYTNNISILNVYQNMKVVANDFDLHEQRDCRKNLIRNMFYTAKN